MTGDLQLIAGDDSLLALIPDSLKAEALDLRDSFNNDYFRAGDFARNLILENAARGMVVHQRAVFEGVGRLIGKTARTVRYYYETACFFSPETRLEYKIVPFSIFVFARYCGQDWRAVLEYTADHYFISREAVEYWYQNRPTSAPALPTLDIPVKFAGVDGAFTGYDVPEIEIAHPNHYGLLRLITKTGDLLDLTSEVLKLAGEIDRETDKGNEILFENLERNFGELSATAVLIRNRLQELARKNKVPVARLRAVKTSHPKKGTEP